MNSYIIESAFSDGSQMWLHQLLDLTRAMNSYVIECIFSDGIQVWLRQVLYLKRIE